MNKMKPFKFTFTALGKDKKDAWNNAMKKNFKQAQIDLFPIIEDLDEEAKSFYTSEVYICEDCGSMSWKEISDKAILIGVNPEGYTQKEDEDWQDSDTYRDCRECGRDNLVYIELDEFGKNNEECAKKVRELNNMSMNERKEWLTKREVIQKLK